MTTPQTTAPELGRSHKHDAPIPEAGVDEDIPVAAPHSVIAAQVMIGAALVVIGALLLADQFLPDLDRYFWPLLLMAVGAIVVFRGDRR